jgi:DNA topoisomerase I
LCRKRKEYIVGKALVIVESPAKARTIAKYLGKDYIVESSIGHIRDLPSSAEEIPAQHKGKPWARTGVDVDNDFSPLYIVPPAKKAQVQKLKSLLEDADQLFLATDEDREGEAIAWHLKEVLKPKVPVKRMVFHEITEAAIKAALKNPRNIDQQVVDAQEARRILDRLYGYEVSPILWRKVAPRLSAGRVQSVATRLIVERERQRIAFRSGTYWDLSAELEKAGQSQLLHAELTELDGQRIARGTDFDSTTGKLSATSKARLLDEAGAKALAEQIKTTPLHVSEVLKKPFTQRPSAPFTTSTLQQESGRKLRYTAQRTMRIAQKLYENGYITYMRTDSTTLSEQAVLAARSQIGQMYGADYVPDAPRTYATKAKGAQEAHEAIRPAGETFRTPDEIKEELMLHRDLGEEAVKLYDLIWKRTVASQMKDAHGERTQVRIESKTKLGTALLQASGKVILFAGFLRAYVEGSDDPDAELEEQERVLPPVAVGDALRAERVEAAGHQTQPPARYTEASLVKELEDRGIGRPSTYASIIGTIQDRGYVFKKGTALVPTFTAFAVINLLEKHFEDLVDYAFTASMENDLDAISEGTKQATPWLKAFYFGSNTKKGAKAIQDVGLKAKVSTGVDDIDPRAICEMPLGKNDDGDLVAARVGRYGPYVQIGDSDKRTNIPQDVAPDEMNVARALQLIAAAGLANRPLGVDPATKKPIYVKSGRFGPYVQLGDMELNAKGKPIGDKPRMASLWPGMVVTSLTLEQAHMVLSFPRTVGIHPDSGLPVIIYDGKFGPYVMMQGKGKDGLELKETRSLPDRGLMTTMTLEQAVALLAQPRVNRGRQQVAQAPVASIGVSPTTKLPIEVRTGRFGNYVTDGQVNATVPSGRDPSLLTFDEALELIAAREAKMREQGLDPRPPAKAPAAVRAPSAKAAKKVTAKPATKSAPKATPATKPKAAPKKATKTSKAKTKAPVALPAKPTATTPLKAAKKAAKKKPAKKKSKK